MFFYLCHSRLFSKYSIINSHSLCRLLNLFFNNKKILFFFCAKSFYSTQRTKGNSDDQRYHTTIKNQEQEKFLQKAIGQSLNFLSTFLILHHTSEVLVTKKRKNRSILLRKCFLPALFPVILLRIFDMPLFPFSLCNCLLS